MRDPDNELYDAVCELLAAAQRVNRAAHGERLERAVPAALGCIESTLGDLTVACAALQASVPTARPEPFDDLVHALRRAESSCNSARAVSAAPAARPARAGR